MTSYVVASTAYAKIAFHAAKYPHRQVNGVLIGKEEANTVSISDAIPMLHHWVSLSPSMEIGLDLVSFFVLDLDLNNRADRVCIAANREAQHYAESLGLDVVGYYQASEHANDTTLVPVGERIAELIKKTFPNAVAFVVSKTRPCIRIHLLDFCAQCFHRWVYIKLRGARVLGAKAVEFRIEELLQARAVDHRFQSGLQRFRIEH